VKTRAKDDLGVEHEVIAVKGSGWDMADIEPQGLPAVKLEALRKLRALDTLSDEAMVNVQAPEPARCLSAESFGRDAAARIPAAQIHRPYPCRRGALDRRSGRRRGPRPRSL
jgi:hypothetical protein